MTRRRQATRRPCPFTYRGMPTKDRAAWGPSLRLRLRPHRTGCTFLYQVPKVFGIVSVQLQREVPVRVERNFPPANRRSAEFAFAIASPTSAASVRIFVCRASGLKGLPFSRPSGRSMAWKKMSRASCLCSLLNHHGVACDGRYGSGVPGAIGGYCFRLCSNSAMILIAGPAFHVFRSAVCGYSSFGSVIRSKALRHAELGGRRPPVALLVVEDDLPVPPLHRLEAVGHEHRKAFAAGLLGLPSRNSV